MAFTFPSSPITGDTYTVNNKTWEFNGVSWDIVVSTINIADGAVTTGKLDANAITETKIASNAVTEAKIANSSITTAKIAAGAVEESDIASSAVTEAKIASNAVTTGKLGTDVQLGYRNVVINGAMQVAQRGTSTAGITTDGFYTADRWAIQLGSLGTWTQSVENDAPTGSGFRKSLKMLCTTADASPSASDALTVVSRLEGQNVQQFLKGTSSAKQFAVSFWVKSNVTGTYVVELYDVDNSRQVSASYTISASATWEKKTLVFPADTTGAFDNDNARSLDMLFWLGAGTTFTSGTLNTTWGTITQANRDAGQTNLAAATNNYWQITGVQLEAGSVATPFEFEDYGVTLAKCQRYLYRNGAKNGTTADAYSMHGAGFVFDTDSTDLVIHYPVEMRTGSPTITFSNLVAAIGTTGSSIAAIGNAGSTTHVAFLRCDHASGRTAGSAAVIYNNNNTSGFLQISAEL